MNSMKILCLGTTPAVQRVMIFHKLSLDAVNRAATTLDGAAGKSVNVAKALKSLGEKPVAIGFLGGDRGKFLHQALEANGIESDFVTVLTPTRQCITVIDESVDTHTELVEESRPVGTEDFDKLMAVVRRRMPECRAMVMSGTIITGGPTILYFECTQLAENAGLMSVVDGQGMALLEALPAKPGLVKPNRSELAATLELELKDDAGVRQAMHQLYERGAQRVVVTAGKEATLAFDGKIFWQVMPPRIKTVNPIGSGDACTAGLVSRLLRGDDLGEACRWGTAAGSANALTPMPGEVNQQDVERLVREIGVRKM
jgi:1-phosphofructokinase family hexose kinase